MHNYPGATTAPEGSGAVSLPLRVGDRGTSCAARCLYLMGKVDVASALLRWFERRLQLELHQYFPVSIGDVDVTLAVER